VNKDLFRYSVDSSSRFSLHFAIHIRLYRTGRILFRLCAVVVVVVVMAVACRIFDYLCDWSGGPRDRCARADWLATERS